MARGPWVWAGVWWTAVIAGVVEVTVTSCDVQIDGITYREQTLVSDVENPSGLVVEYITNMLYFSYNKNHSYVSAKLDLRTGELSEIEELSGWCRFTVDRERGQVYAGCGGYSWGHWQGDGLYQFDSSVGRFVPVGEAGKRVRFVYYNQVLYYSFRDSLLLYTFHSDHGTRVKDLMKLVEGLVINKNADRIFCDHGYVYRQQAGGGEVTMFTELYYPRALAVDNNGTAYTCGYTDLTSDTVSISRLHDAAPTVTGLLNVTDCSSLTFDKDNNIIYSYHDKIERLTKC